MNSLLRGMGVSGSTGTATTSSQYPQQQNQLEQHQQPLPPQPPTATELARRAPHAGFLQKLGSNIPTYKRRFFVLQPSTQLYYFVSPNDTMPRGAIAIDEARIERMTMLDGMNNHNQSSKFALHWPDGSSIQLEARSAEMADAWCDSLQRERLPYVRSQLEESQQHCAEAQGEIDDLKRQLEQYRFVEQDRDGALEDARRWKQQFEALDESLRLLANHVRKMPSTEEALKVALADNRESESETAEAVLSPQSFDDNANDDNDDNDVPRDKTNNNELVSGEMKLRETASCDVLEEQQPQINEEGVLFATPEMKGNEEKKEDEDTESGDTKQVTSNIQNNVNLSRDVSLLDDDAAAEVAAALLFQSNNIIEDLDAPGQHFSSLVNACQQLRENLRLASEEATTAVEDSKEAHTRAESLQKRMTKAEKQLCQLWEENCSIRKVLKQKKRERRVLVREVKSLMEQQQHKEQLHCQALREAELSQRHYKTKTKSNRGAPNADDSATVIGSDEERLINELEEHVVSSIRLNQEFLSPASDTKRHQKISSSSTFTTAASTKSGISDHPSTARLVSNNAASNRVGANPDSFHPAVSSLFDGGSSDSDSETEDEATDIKAQLGIAVSSKYKGNKAAPTAELATGKIGVYQPVHIDTDARSISSVAASFGGGSNSSIGRSQGSSPLRPNPLLQLDQEEDEVRSKEEKLFKPISVAQSGNATSRLVCPLADVVQTKPNLLLHKGRRTIEGARSNQEDLQVYHVTFYTRKIGLQFQKVPPPPTRSRGLLTDAMTADLAGGAHANCKTAAELKRVATISDWAKTPGDNASGRDSALQLATPIDAVLVCGFEGFDDSGNNVRPKLGSRLVAFDGISVEIGEWTFDSIRKGIQARSRPLTLSFRNDFLTTDQRAIMTKVVEQMEKDQALSAPSVAGLGKSDLPQNVPVARPPSEIPSLESAPSHETAHFVNETTINAANTIEYGYHKRPDFDEDDLTVSTTGYYSDYQNGHSHHQQPHYQQRRFTASSNGSFGSGRPPPSGSYSYRSFSEAGSSASALSSAIGPLMSNLMSGISAEKKRAKAPPDYLLRRDPVENTPEHQDFRSNLL